MNRTTVIASVSIALAFCAVVAGWLHYQAQPEGDLFYTPIAHCDPRSHSFSSAFHLTLIGEALVCLVLAAAATLGTFVPRWSNAKHAFRGIAKAALIVVAVLSASLLLSPIFEARLPLRIPAECQQNAH